MYVIINDHWDNQWWGQFGACTKDAEGNKVVDEETRKNAWVRYERYWTQIAERFKGYSDHLIFEGANEELGDRLNDAICINGPAKGYQKPAPGNEDTPGEGEQTTITYPAKGTKITNGNFIYKVTKAATAKTKGAVTLTGLSTKGKKAKTLGMTDTIKGTKGESYVVNALGSKAFSGAKAKSITLNKNIKVVPSKAFANCKRLTKLTFKAKLTKVSKNAFPGCKNKLSIKGTKAASNKKLVKKVYKKVK